MLGNAAPRCDACGIASSRDIRNAALLVEGQLDSQVRLCPACLDDVRTAVRDILGRDRVIRVSRR